MKKLIAAMFTISLAGLAFAGDMQDKENLDNGQKLTDEAAARVANDQNCGGPVTGKIDRATFKGDAATGVSQYCANVVDGVSGACQLNPTHKKDILKAVKSVTCHYDAKVTESYGLKLVRKGTNLDAYFNKDSANIGATTGEWLTKNL